MLSSVISQRRLTIRQLETGWLEAGERGRPVIFMCHGFPDSPSVWSRQIEDLSKSYHVVAPYVRGCEASVASDDIKRYGRESVVLDHLAILAETTNGNEPVICVGHDLGAAHAFTLARRLGDRLAGLVIINGLDVEMFKERLRDPSQVLRSWYMGFMQIPVLPEMLAKMAPNTASWLAESLAGGEASQDVAQGFARRAAATLNQYRAFARETTRQPAPRVRLKAPVLVLWGRDDGVLLPPTQSEWDRVALKSEIRIIPGGHWLHRDHPEVVTDFITQFADKLLRKNEHD